MKDLKAIVQYQIKPESEAKFFHGFPLSFPKHVRWKSFAFLLRLQS